MMRILTTLFLAVVAFALRKVGRHASPLPAIPPPPLVDSASREAGHEESEPRPWALALVFGGVFLTIIVTMLVVGRMYTHFYSASPAMTAPVAETRFSYSPWARSSIADDWIDIDVQSQKRLGAYGWVNQASGVLHIPISRAMQLVIREGLPARQTATPDFPDPSAEKLPLSETETSSHAPNSY